jgi:hypothetical protein
VWTSAILTFYVSSGARAVGKGMRSAVEAVVMVERRMLEKGKGG